MKCPKCGIENPYQAKFCKSCGAPLVESEQEDSAKVRDKEIDKPQNKKKWRIGAACLLLITILLALVIVIGNVRRDKEYERYISSANRYIEQANYDKAEDAYLKAIDVDPKEEEPYLCLADIYAGREDYEKAVQILKKANKSTSFKNAKNKDSTDSKSQENVQNKVKQKLDEFVNMTEYTWKVEPSIEADNIYYLKNNDISQASVNEMNLQLANEYAVIKNETSLGLIDMMGNKFEDEEYKSVYVGFGHYVIEYPEQRYDEETGSYTNFFFLIDGKLSFAMFSGKPLEQTGGVYYWTEGLHNTEEVSREDSYYSIKEPPVPIPVRKSDREMHADESWIDWNNNLTGKYAIYYDGGLVSDFIYDQCGSYADGLMAVCNDGKWGYVDKNGKIVIPLEYESSWKEYVPYKGVSGQEEYCYAVSEGYVPLVRDGKWEMRNTGGKVVIPSGIFEAIRPVHDSKCWVKKNGKWGVIELQGDGKDKNADKGRSGDKEKAETITADTYLNLYDPILQDINATYGSMNIYYFFDIDKNGVKELLAEEGTCEGDYMYKIYTISDGKSKYLGEVSGFHCGFYMDENNGTGDYIIRAEGFQGYERLSYIKIENGTVVEEQISERQLEQNDSYYSQSKEVPNASVTDMSLLQSDSE